MALKKTSNNSRKSDSSAYWQMNRDNQAAAKRSSSSTGSGTNSVKKQTSPPLPSAQSKSGAGSKLPVITLPATAPAPKAASLPNAQSGNKLPVIALPATAPTPKAASLPNAQSGNKLPVITLPATAPAPKAQSKIGTGSQGKLSDSAAKRVEELLKRSDIPSSKTGSFINSNLLRADKRAVMEETLAAIRSTPVSGLKQLEEMQKREKNVAHQLMMLDNAEGKAPKSYMGQSGAAPSANVTKKAVVPGSSKPEVYTDTRQEYVEYAKQARRPSQEEYQQLKRAGSNISYQQYVQQKQNAKVKSYDQFAQDRATGKPDTQTYGNVTLEKRPDAAYYTQSGGYTPSNTPSAEYQKTGQAVIDGQEKTVKSDDGGRISHSEQKQEPEDLMRQAREKYNEDTIHIYTDETDTYSGDRFAVRFYKNGAVTNINIPDSLSVTSKYEMAAIIEQIMESGSYREDLFGTKEHMVAQWLAHNIAHNISTIENTPEEMKRILSIVSGAGNPEESSRTLDLRQIGNTLKRQDIIYKLLEQFAP